MQLVNAGDRNPLSRISGLSVCLCLWESLCPRHCHTFAPISMSLRRSTTTLFRRASAALLESQQTSMNSMIPNSNAMGGVFSLGARRAFASDADLQKTALYDFHVKHGGTCRRRVVGLWATQTLLPRLVGGRAGRPPSWVRNDRTNERTNPRVTDEVLTS